MPYLNKIKDINQQFYENTKKLNEILEYFDIIMILKNIMRYEEIDIKHIRVIYGVSYIWWGW